MPKLAERECETAFAGGVNVSVHPNKYLMLYQNRFYQAKADVKVSVKAGTVMCPVKEWEPYLSRFLKRKRTVIIFTTDQRNYRKP